MSKEINLDAMSVVELKALAFDVIGELERMRGNLAQIQQIIVKKAAAGNSSPEEVK